ncbi:MAG: phosphatidylglycerophosphatase A [Nitrospiraceae bacterium]|nr:phosphatidylglycerophosphatase A [Nitrospiraceae bacterium]
MNLSALSKAAATGFFIGYIPYVPGTFGTAAGLILMVFISPVLQLHIFLAVFLIIIGIFASGHAEKSFNEKDPQCIVIDELAGYVCSLIFLPLNWKYIISAFLLFRFFDIIKPFPIRQIELKLRGGLGIMADDIMAAAYTNIVLQIWKILT